MRVPDLHWYDTNHNAHMYTGAPALEAFGDTYNGGPVAADIETKGLDIFTVRCITYSWHGKDGATHSVLLDMNRDPAAFAEARHIMDQADAVAFHNSPFDVVPLVHFGVMTKEDVFKVWDTIVLARMAFPDTQVRKNLEGMGAKMRLVTETGGLARAIKASGLKTKDRWYSEGDIHLSSYRAGAMADTIITLRLLPILIDAIHAKLTDHPFERRGLSTAAEAQLLVEREMTTNRVMLWRSARGIRVDLDYMHRYRDGVADQVAQAESVLIAAGLEPGRGDHLVAHLDSLGELPKNWKRTATGKLSADKKAMEALGTDHPLSAAHRVVADQTKIGQYLDGVASRAEVTGRCHPSVGILGASATGRMAYSDPPLQQFSADARPILVDDGQGFTSVDWSAIEPVVMANAAGDFPFLEPFIAGADIYEPIQRAAGIDRKRAKTVLLGTLYGQGKFKLGESLGCSPEQAVQIQQGMFATMPQVQRFIETLKSVANQFAIVPTADGRILDVDVFEGQVKAYTGVNYFCQGSAYSVMSDTINRIHAAGLSDHIYLAMHDELVVSTPAAAEIEWIMQQTPQFLMDWTDGKATPLRTDSNDMAGAWAYV